MEPRRTGLVPPPGSLGEDKPLPVGEHPGGAEARGLEDVEGAFRRGVPETVNALYYLRNCAIRMKTVLEEGRIEEFGELIVAGISGSYDTVMGLPVDKVIAALG